MGEWYYHFLCGYDLLRKHNGFQQLLEEGGEYDIPLAGRVFAALVTNGTGSLTCRLAGSLALAASALLHGIL